MKIVILTRKLFCRENFEIKNFSILEFFKTFFIILPFHYFYFLTMTTKVEIDTTHVYIKFNNRIYDYDVKDFKDLSSKVEIKLGIKMNNQKFIHAGKSFTKKEIDSLSDFSSNGITDGVNIELVPLIVGG